MGKINVLSFAVANLIAAGEVVDRPASVVKELMENAIDSGADKITVEIQNGGVSLIRVRDNGCGMDKDDLPVAVRRHATSKIHDASDLDGIMTLGFRGEALAAIAAVSDLRIISRVHGQPTGACIEVSGGEVRELHEQGCSEGTTVMVENLFCNVPARRKFLKKDVTEATAVYNVVERVALSRPDIAFDFIMDGKCRIQTAGDGKLYNTIYALYGRDFAKRLIAVEYEYDGISVHGYIGRSDNVKPNRNGQTFYINDRLVKSRTVMAALEQAYASYMPQERFPVCTLFLDINPRAVDVNVHPAKLEVKFSNEKPVFEAVYYAVKKTLESNTTRPDIPVEKLTHMSYEQYREMYGAGAVKKDAPGSGTDKRPGGQNGGWSGAQTGAQAGAKSDGQSDARSYAQPYVQPEILTGAQTGAQPDVPHDIEPECTAIPAGSLGKRAPDAEQLSVESYIASAPVASGAKAPVYGAQPVPDVPPMPGVPLMPDVPPRYDAPLIPDVPPMYRTSPMSPTSDNTDVPDTLPTPEISPMPGVPEPSGSVRPPRQSAKMVQQTIADDGPGYRIVGEAFRCYVIVERGEQMLLIDKHAAHERIIFEQLKAGLRHAEKDSQLLMVPLEFMLTSDEVLALEAYHDEIEAIGFRFTAEKYTVSVTAVPESIELSAVPDIFMTLADRVRNQTGTAELTRDMIFEKALYQASCKAAIKGGREYADEHIQWIVAQLMTLPDITFCPHGRPVAMVIKKSTLDRQFLRT